MNIRSGFFNSINGDRRYEADFFADYFATFIGNGIFANPSDNFQVMANDDMTIRVRPGSAWIKGYVAFNDSDYKFALEAASGVLNRIDRVVLRLDASDRQIKLEVKQGEPAEVPDPMELERSDNAWELALADVYIGKGVISVTQADITDTRFDDKLCGIVKGVVDEIDTTDLFAQYDAEFSQWLKGLQDALDGDVAGNLMNLINEVKGDLDIVSLGYNKFKESKGKGDGIAPLDNGGDVPLKHLGNVTKEFVVGSYTGNDGETIVNVGFEPSAVIVYSRKYAANRMWHGMVTKNHPQYSDDGKSVALRMTSYGFVVDSVRYGYLTSSTNSPHRYIAFK